VLWLISNMDFALNVYFWRAAVMVILSLDVEFVCHSAALMVRMFLNR
jgi:hypothetical protein